MGFLDDVNHATKKLLQGASKLIGEAADGSKLVIARQKLKSQMQAEKTGISRTYFEIGKRYYEENHAAPPENYAAEFDAISNSKENIEQLKAKIEELGGNPACPNCEVRVKKGQLFCHMCGVKLPVTEPVQGEVVGAGAGADSDVDSDVISGDEISGIVSDDVSAIVSDDSTSDDDFTPDLVVKSDNIEVI